MAHPTEGYYNAAGKRIPGTTTIIGRFKDSGALLWWACEQGKAIQRGEIKSLYDKRDEAADIGTQIHEWVERHIKGEDPETPKNDAVASGIEAYLSWESMTKLVIVEQEIQLVSEEYQFGGCPDAIGLVNGELCLLDWKSSKGVYQDFLIQLAAYNHLWTENFPDQPLTGGFHLCKFSKENGDFSHHYWPNLDEAWEAFKHMRALYDIDKRLKKRAA